MTKRSLVSKVLLLALVSNFSMLPLSYAKKDRDNNPPGPKGGAGTNWENPPGPKGGPGASPDRHLRHDKDNNPPGPKGGPGTNWENPPGPKGGPGAGPDRMERKPKPPRPVDLNHDGVVDAKERKLAKKKLEENPPAGWDKGKKTGWDGAKTPPGQNKES